MEAAKNKVKNVLDKIAIEQDYDNYEVNIESINGNGSNITSALFDVKLNAPDKEELKLFAKVSTLSKTIREKSVFNDMWTTELLFYKKIKKEFERLQDKHGISEEHRLMLPKYYGSCSDYLEEVIVLENLVDIGFASYNRKISIDWEYAAAVIEQLAKFHALSYAYKDDNPEDFEQILKKVPLKTADNYEFKELFTNHMLPNVYEISTDENRKIIKSYFESGDRFDLFSSIFCKELNILIHGDAKASNMMHRRVNGKLQILPVDFQLVHNGNIVADLMYFIFTASDEEFRRRHYHQLLDHYYQELKAALERLGLNPDEAYPEEDYREQLEEGKMLGLLIAVTMLPMATVAEDNAPDLSEESLEGFAVKPNQLFKERFNGVVNNYREWGLL